MDKKRKVIVFSGAGLSADSGMPTFRDSNGLWENHSVEDVATHESWYEHDKQDLMRRFYGERFKQYKNCKPHAGHEALAKLEDKFDVTHVTQNIDNLLEDAGCTDVKHVHGRIKSKKCERHIDITTLDGDGTFVCDYKAECTESDSLDLWGGKCPKCDSELRPDVVWFNECVHLDFEEMKEWVRLVKYEEGVFICAGTSVQVYPAGYLLSFFSQVKEKYIVDLHPQAVADYVLLEGKASDLLPALVEKLLS